MRRASLARQLLILQVVVVAATVAIAGAAAYLAARDSVRGQQREQVLSLATSLAQSGEVRSAARASQPQVTLQPLAERVRRATEVGFVVFMTPDGRRWSHPDPGQVGRRFVGRIAPARRGRAFTESTTGTLGPSIRAVAPIRSQGRVVGLVAVGVLDERVADRVADLLPALALALVLALAVGVALSLLLSRRVRRQTHGMDPGELAALYEHNDAVLHAIREGVVVVDSAGRVALMNDQARRLLGVEGDPVGRAVGEVVGQRALAATLRGDDDADGDLHVVGGRVLVTGRRTAGPGVVTTLRDRTELEGLMRELDTVQGMADALRAQAHEAANELHTVVGLVELGRHDDAVAFATRRIGVTQDEVDLVQQRLGDPALAALVLGKAAACRERGVALALDPASELPEGALPSEDLVTVAGNLVDNALDALAGRRGGRIGLRAAVAGGQVTIEVSDDGPGIDSADLGRVFEAGWSTKGGAGRRGLGLALVRATAERLGGAVAARNEGGAVFTFTAPIHDPVPTLAPAHGGESR